MPVRNEEWMGLNNFVWFFGVVEDVSDPLNIGRVRVRCYGWHSEDKAALPTIDLPWAQVMMPTTSSSAGGLGRSPTGLLPGASVVGFFMDGTRAQTPMIMGSFHGVANKTDSIIPFPDTPDLAYDRWLEDSISINKKEYVVENVKTAGRYKVVTAHDKPESAYDPVFWSEPEQRGGKESSYPSNHVTRTPSGHAFEVDDTAGCERIHEYHAAGTFYEVQPDGSRITKVVGSDYEIVIQDKNVFVYGDCNITVNGNARLRVDGDLVQEILGNHHLTVHGDTITKVMGNESKEILGEVSHQVNGRETRRITGNNTITTGGSLTENIGVDMATTVGKDYNGTIDGSYNSTSKGDTNIISIANMNIGAGGKSSIASSGNMKLKTAGNQTVIVLKDQYTSLQGDTRTRKKAGLIDYTCSTDTRTSMNDCTDIT